MKIGLIADVHGNRPALEQVIAQLRPETDVILFAGDLCGYYPFVADCARLLLKSGVVGVLGNHDSLFLECARGHTPPPADYEQRYGSALRRSLAGVANDALASGWLHQLPVSRFLDIGGRRIAMFHGAPWDALDARVYPDFDKWERFGDTDAAIVILGHTHYALQRRVDGRLIVNPGSVGQARDRRGRACYAILDSASLEVEQYRISFDPSELLADATTHDPDLLYLTQVLSSS